MKGQGQILPELNVVVFGEIRDHPAAARLQRQRPVGLRVEGGPLRLA